VAKRNALRLGASALLAVMFFAGAAFPQGAQTGGITGVVKDPHGGTVAGATVEIYNEKTGILERTLQTETDGSYTVTPLPPGSYRVEISASGFKKFRGIGVPVRLNEITRQDAALEIGELAQSVVVEATPTLINTVSATTGQPVDAHTLSSLPLASPNFLFLLALSPGASGDMPDVRSAGRGNIDINVNGQRTTNNSASLEGINVNDFNLAHFDNVPVPNPDAIQEFKVSTSLYDATQGSKGGGAVSLVLKSGSKDLHGSAFWQHRNDVFNANDWFSNQHGTPRGRLLQNVFGGSASGPVWKLGGFWFANYAGVRGRNGIDPNGSQLSPIIQNFPTNPDGTTSAALLAGAFGLTTPQIDPIAVNILNLRSTAYNGQFLVPRSGQRGCATASSATGTFTCKLNAIAQISDNQFTISYDRPFRQDKDKVAVRWFYDNGKVTKPFGTAGSLAFPEGVLLNNRFLSFTETHLFSSRQANEFRFGFNRFNQPNTPTDKVSLADIGATRPNISTVPGMYFLSITGLFSVGTGVNDERATVSNSFYYGDTWSMTVGKHTFRAGGEITRYQLNRSNKFAIRGALGFDATKVAGVTVKAFNNFLQGQVGSLQSGAGDPQRYFRALDAASFFQDDWRILPRLSLNLGLRYDLLGFAHDKFFRSGIYDPTLLQTSPPTNPFLFAQALNLGGFRGTPGVSDCTLKHCYASNDFAPRIGFAWDVFGNENWVLRGGYGIYYQQLSNQNLLQGSLAAPFFVQLINSTSSPAPFQLQNPLAGQPASTAIATAFIPQVAQFAGLRLTSGSGPLDPNKSNVGPIFVNQAGQACQGFGGTATNCVINLASFASANPNTRPPYTEQWNFTVQHELWKSWAMELGYVGAHYVGGLGIWDPQLAALASPAHPIVVTDTTGKSYSITTNTANNEPLRHLVLGLSRAKGARYVDNIGQGTYNSAQLTISHRFHGGLFFQGAYTYSHTIDNVSGSQSTDELNATRSGQGGANLLNFQNNPHQNRSRGDFDRPHRLIASYAWDLPVPKQGIWGSQAFQGWTLSGIVTYQNGLPFSLSDSTSGGAFGSVRVGTGMLICPAAVANASLPACTAGSATTLRQLQTSGPIQNRIGNYLNPNMVSTALQVPNSSDASVTGFGNIPRNAFRGPFQSDWDFSVAKNFHITERHQIQFRSDFFNLFNHPVFSSPSSVNVASPSTFAQITTTAIPPRLIQFGLRYSF
jgi:hypothetical protein